MATAQYCSRRLNLKTTLAAVPALAGNKAALALCKKFDMCRVFASTLGDAGVAKYAALEHVMRITTLYVDIEPYFDIIPGDVSLALHAILNRKAETQQMAIRELETFLALDVFQLIPNDLPVCLVLHRLVNDEILKSTIEPEVEGKWPIVNCFSSADFLCLLYPTEVTFIDGYEPVTGGYKEPYIPQSMLLSIVQTLYFVQKRTTISAQTQTKRPKGVKEQSSVEESAHFELEVEPPYKPEVKPVEIGASVGLFSILAKPPSDTSKSMSSYSQPSPVPETTSFVPQLPVINFPVPFIRSPSPEPQRTPEILQTPVKTPVETPVKTPVKTPELLPSPLLTPERIPTPVRTPPAIMSPIRTPPVIMSPARSPTPDSEGQPIGASVGLTPPPPLRPSLPGIERTSNVSIAPRADTYRPQSNTVVRKTIVIHRSRMSRKTEPNTSSTKFFKDEFDDRTEVQKWEFMDFRREQGKESRPREGCGLVDDCTVF